MTFLTKVNLAAATIVGVMCLSTPNAQAIVVWDEAIDGDLSNDRLNPTSASLAFGSNTLTATSVGPSDNADREYITFSMPPMSRLSAIYLDAYAGDDETAFIGVQSGTTFTEPPTGTTVGNLLGYNHFGPAVEPVGSNILPGIGMGFGSMGFTPPLPAGNYTFWIQQTGLSAATYTFDFVVTPEPGALMLLSVGGVIALAAKRRQRR